MTKKTYTVLKAVKIDGEERGEGAEVSLEPGQAEKLLGTFVEEKGASTKESASSGGKSKQASDGL